MLLSIGQRVGQFEVLKELGRGGMGIVYLAFHEKLQRQVALKVFTEPLVQDEERFRRFRMETLAISRLNHPNILTIHDVVQTEQTHFMVTEYVEGRTLRELLSKGHLDVSKLLDLMIQVLSALKAAHEAGIVHRDIKPENIMVRNDGIVKVVDFGLAKLVAQLGNGSKELTLLRTAPGLVMGTPQYMSPEQVKNLPLDSRTDLFSFGAVIYEGLAGRAAFTGDSVANILGQIQFVNPRPPSQLRQGLPEELDRITLKLLEKEVEDRYESAEEVLSVFRGIRARYGNADVESTNQRRTSITTRILKSSNGFRVAVLANVPRATYLLSTLGVLLLSVAVVWLLTRTPIPRGVNWYERGVEALRYGAFYQARVSLERAAKVQNSSALVHARLAETYLELDNQDKARDELYTVTKLVPDRSSLTQLDRLSLEAVIALAAKDYPTAIESYREIVQLRPNEPYAHVDLGRVLEKSNDIGAATESYLTATKLNHEYAAAFLRLGVLFGREENIPASARAFDEAESVYLAQANVEGQAEVCYQRGLLSLRGRRTADAESDLRRAQDLSRAAGNEVQQVSTLLQLSHLSIVEGNTEQAQVFARQALEFAQKNSMENVTLRGLVDIGSAFFHRGSPEDLKQAEKYFNQALEYAQHYKDRRNEARARFQLASLYLRLGRTEDGLRNAEEALAYYKEGKYAVESWEALRLIGRAKRDQGSYDDALRTFEEQLEIAKQMNSSERMADAHEEIGRVLETTENYPKALDHFNESYRINSRNSDKEAQGYLQMSRARVLWQVGRYDSAVNAFKEAEAAAGHEYIELLSACEQYTAEMDLSRGRFAQVKTKLQSALKQLSSGDGGDQEAAIEIRRLVGEAEATSGPRAAGLQLCREAADIASKGGDPLLITKTLLSLARSLLNGQEMEEAAIVALRSQERAHRVRQYESEWKAWMVAALASRGLGQTEKAHEYGTNASQSLLSLRNDWGDEVYADYLTRPDIQMLYRQLAAMTAGPRT